MLSLFYHIFSHFSSCWSSGSRQFFAVIFFTASFFLVIFCVHGRSDALLGNTNVLVEGFQTRGLNQSGAVEWELQGQQARIKGAVTDVESFQIILHQDQGRFYELSSPKCSFYHNQDEVKSDSPLLLSSEGITISGIGYDIFLDHKIVLIRATVHIVLQGKNSNLRNLTPKPKSNTP